MGAVIDYSKMQIGAKGNGKHWTAKEVKARQEAAEKTIRKTKIKLKMPERLREEEKLVWTKTIKEMSGFDILDNVDAEQLAIYCETVVKRNGASEILHKEGMIINTAFGIKEHPCIKIEQSYSRLILQYAERLGLTPNGRARLAKKEANGKVKDKNGDLFD